MKNCAKPLCYLLSLACSAAVSVCAESKPSQYLRFYNLSGDVVNLSLEEAGLPTYGAAKQRTIKPNGNALVKYDPAVANCVLIVPEKKELGVQTSLFVIEPTDTQFRPDPVVANCSVEIRKTDEKHRTYGLNSTCVRVAATGH